MMLKKKKKLMFEARCNINAGDKGLRRIVEVRSEIRSIESSLFRISKLESLDRRKKGGGALPQVRVTNFDK